MRAVARHIAAGKIVRHAVGVDREWEIVHRLADVDPVRREHIDRLLRQVKGPDDFRGAVARHAHKVRVLAQHAQLAHRCHGYDVHAVVHAAAEADEFQHLVVSAGAGGVNVARHVLVAVVQHGVDALAGHDDAVRLRHRQPVDVNAHVVKKLADLQPFAFRADGHHLMQRGLHLKAVAHVVRGDTAGHVVLFEDQNVPHALGLQLQGGRHAGQRAADDDDIIVVFVKTQVNSSFCV